MTYDEDVSPRERKIARSLAIGMHVVVLVLLIFGVVWQKRTSEPAAIVELWGSMAPPKAEPAPRPKPEPEPKPRPKPEPKPEPKAPPPPPPKPEVKAVPKADIALKEKLEKERKVKEQQEQEKKKQQELERRKEEESKKLKAQQQLETRKLEEEKKKLEKERLAQEAEAKKAAAEKAAMDAKLAKEAAAARAGEMDKYTRMIRERVRRFIVEPPNLQGNPEVEIELRILPGGDVLEPSVRVRRSSGNPAYDQAVERAVMKASPLPVPSDPAMFNQLRELNLKVRPRE